MMSSKTAGEPHFDVVTTHHRFSCGDGPDRTYSIYRPTGHRPLDGLPVIVDLHGSGESPTQHARTTDAERAAAAGYVVVIPAALIPFTLIEGSLPGTAWNIPGTPLPGQATAAAGPDDIAFLTALFDRLHRHHRFAPDRFHLRGYSGGARLASLLAAQHPTRIASLCAVAGIRFPGSPLPVAPTEVPPVLAVHGRLDTLNPYSGGIPVRWQDSVETATESWARAAHTVDITHHADKQIVETRYVRPDGWAPVRLITVIDGGHAWPGSRDPEHQQRFGPTGQFSADRAHRDFVRDVETLRQQQNSAGPAPDNDGRAHTGD